MPKIIHRKASEVSQSMKTVPNKKNREISAANVTVSNTNLYDYGINDIPYYDSSSQFNKSNITKKFSGDLFFNKRVSSHSKSI